MSENKLFTKLAGLTVAAVVSTLMVAAPVTVYAEDTAKPDTADTGCDGEGGCNADKSCSGEAKCSGEKKCSGEAKCSGEKAAPTEPAPSAE